MVRSTCIHKVVRSTSMHKMVQSTYMSHVVKSTYMYINIYLYYIYIILCLYYILCIYIYTLHHIINTACCRKIEIALHLIALSYIYLYITQGILEHIGCLVRMSVSGYRGRRFESRHKYAASLSKTLSALLQSTQLWNEYQVGTTSWRVFSAMSFSEE